MVNSVFLLALLLLHGNVNKYFKSSSLHFENNFIIHWIYFYRPSESCNNKYISHLWPQIWRNIADCSWKIPKQWEIHEDFCW